MALASPTVSILDTASDSKDRGRPPAAPRATPTSARRNDNRAALHTNAPSRKGNVLSGPPAKAARAAADTHRPIHPTAGPRTRDARAEADRRVSVLQQGRPVSVVEPARSGDLRSAC